MKKIILIILIVLGLGACTSTEVASENNSELKVTERESGVEIKTIKEIAPLKKVAILLPINNTNDQNTADLFWKEISEQVSEIEGSQVLAPEEVENRINALGYDFGDQLLQVDTVEERKKLQEDLGVDGIVYFSVDEIKVSLEKSLRPTTLKKVKAKSTLYVDGEKIRVYDITGVDINRISNRALFTILKIGGSFALDQDLLALIFAIEAIVDPVIRKEVIDGVLAMTGPVGAKFQTLLYEKEMLKESPFKLAIDNAVGAVINSL